MIDHDAEDMSDVENILNDIVELLGWEFVRFTEDGDESKTGGFLIGTSEMVHTILQTSDISPNREDLN